MEFLRSDLLHAPTPAIAGVKLRGYGSGHFIAILERQGDRWLVADPLQGRFVGTRDELAESYQFTGFFMKLERAK